MCNFQLTVSSRNRYPLDEPTVWVGVESDFDPATGNVLKSYPTSYENTLRAYGWFGFTPRNTSAYYFGSASVRRRENAQRENAKEQDFEDTDCNTLFLSSFFFSSSFRVTASAVL